MAKDDPIPAQDRQRWVTALDLPGIALFAGTITSLLLFLADLTAPTWWLLPIVIVLGAALLTWERLAGRPLIDVRMLATNMPLLRTYLRQALVALGIYAALYGASQWMEQSARLSASAVGLILLPLSGLSIVIARVVSGKGWVRWPLILSGVALILTTGVMLLITHESSVLLL
ncbi:MAG: MFS transporter, partial [Nakamurella sp.]